MHRLEHRSLGKTARLLLQIGAPLILLSAIIFLVSYLIAWETDPVYAIIRYHPYVGYLLYPIVIIAFGVLLIERMEMKE